jgi:hypothetical protein
MTDCEVCYSRELRAEKKTTTCPERVAQAQPADGIRLRDVELGPRLRQLPSIEAEDTRHLSGYGPDAQVTGFCQCFATDGTLNASRVSILWYSMAFVSRHEIFIH